MNRMKIGIVICAAGLMIAACATKPARLEDMKGPGLGMIYGQIRPPSDKEWIGFITIQRIGKVYAGHVLGEHIFFSGNGQFACANLKPGKYRLAQVETGKYVYSFFGFRNVSALGYTVDVQPGGIHYFGAYNLIVLKRSSLFRPIGKFELQPDKTKETRVEILKWAELYSRGTRWHDVIERELHVVVSKLSPSGAVSR